MQDDAYFVRESGVRSAATPLIGGAWVGSEQHVAPAIGSIATLRPLRADRPTA
jgi:hypothetical protein